MAHELADAVTAFCGQIGCELVGKTVIVAGMVTGVRPLFTKQGKPFASVEIEDLDGSTEVMIWNQIFEDTRELWKEGSIVLVKGKVQERGDRIQTGVATMPRNTRRASRLRRLSIRPTAKYRLRSKTESSVERTARPGLHQSFGMRQTVARFPCHWGRRI